MQARIFTMRSLTPTLTLTLSLLHDAGADVYPARGDGSMGRETAATLVRMAASPVCPIKLREQLLTAASPSCKGECAPTVSVSFNVTVSCVRRCMLQRSNRQVRRDFEVRASVVVQ